MSEIQEINQHLEELRKRVLRIVIVVGAITAFLLTFHLEPVQFAGITLYYPIPEPLHNIAALVGIVAAMPIIVKEVVGFLQPALKENEVNISRSISIPAIGLFVSGCVFSYFLVIPYILEFLYLSLIHI